jgi:hypothetical protein
VRAVALVALLAGVARADAPPEAIDVDRDDAPPGRIELGFDGGAPLADWGVSLRLGYLARPLVLSTVQATVVPVDHRETASLGGYLALGDRFVVDARLPLAHQVGARLQGLGDDAPLARFVAGDLALGARVRLAARGPIVTFLRGELTLPTGDSEQFAGASSWTAAWLLVARAQLPHGIALAATGGIRLRGREVMVGDRLVGDELAGGIGVVVPLPPIARLWCVPEQLQATAELVGVLGDRVGGQRGPSPAEARIGIVGAPRVGWTIGARVGVGLDHEIGAPRFRAMLEVAYERGVKHVPSAAPATPRAGDELD